MLLQLRSAIRDEAAREAYQGVMQKPKEGSWKLQRAPYSPAVQLMDESSAAHPELFDRLACLGKGISGSVA